MPLLVSLGVFAALGAVAAVITVGPIWRRAFGFVAGTSTLALPFVTKSEALFVFVLSLGAVLVTLRTIDLVRMASVMTAPQRLWHVFAIFDSRDTGPMTPAFDAALLRRAAAWSALAGVGFVIGVFVANGQAGALHYALRWGGCGVVSLASFEIVAPVVLLVYGLLGIRAPLVHDAPYLSLSVREFWGVRWNRVVGRWLRVNVHAPLARCGHPILGVSGAFLVSGVLHWYLTFAALGWYWSVPMAAFFLTQLVLLGLERAMGVATWPPAAARVWTVGSIVAVLPLFLEPMMQLMDPLVGRT